MEVGCRGFVATSTVRLMKDLGISRQALHQGFSKGGRVEDLLVIGL